MLEPFLYLTAELIDKVRNILTDIMSSNEFEQKTYEILDLLEERKIELPGGTAITDILRVNVVEYTQHYLDGASETNKVNQRKRCIEVFENIYSRFKQNSFDERARLLTDTNSYLSLVDNLESEAPRVDYRIDKNIWNEILEEFWSIVVSCDYVSTLHFSS